MMRDLLTRLKGFFGDRGEEVPLRDCVTPVVVKQKESRIRKLADLPPGRTVCYDREDMAFVAVETQGDIILYRMMAGLEFREVAFLESRLKTLLKGQFITEQETVRLAYATPMSWPGD